MDKPNVNIIKHELLSEDDLENIKQDSYCLHTDCDVFELPKKCYDVTVYNNLVHIDPKLLLHGITLRGNARIKTCRCTLGLSDCYTGVIPPGTKRVIFKGHDWREIVNRSDPEVLAQVRSVNAVDMNSRVQFDFSMFTSPNFALSISEASHVLVLPPNLHSIFITSGRTAQFRFKMLEQVKTLREVTLWDFVLYEKYPTDLKHVDHVSIYNLEVVGEPILIRPESFNTLGGSMDNINVDWSRIRELSTRCELAREILPHIDHELDELDVSGDDCTEEEFAQFLRKSKSVELNSTVVGTTINGCIATKLNLKLGIHPSEALMHILSKTEKLKLFVENKLYNPHALVLAIEYCPDLKLFGKHVQCVKDEICSRNRNSVGGVLPDHLPDRDAISLVLDYCGKPL